MSIKGSVFTVSAAAAVILINLFVIQPALSATGEPNCPAPRPACSDGADCKSYSCKICFPNPLGLHCTPA